MKTNLLARMTSGITDAIHHFEAGDESRQQFLTASALCLRHRNAWCRKRCTRVNADAGIAKAIELESVRKHPVRKRRQLPPRFVLRSDERPFAWRTCALDVFDD